MRFLSLALISTMAVFFSCRHSESTAGLSAVYNGHERRNTTPEENMRFAKYRAAGVVLSARYVLTVEHACPVDEVGFVVNELAGFFAAVTVVERSSLAGGYDYCILEVEWGNSSDQMRFPAKIWSTKDEVKIDTGTSGDPLYALGFPGDQARKGKPTYSSGFARKLEKNDDVVTFLKFDVDAWKGNSGGPVYRSNDNMLVSIISGMQHLPSNGEFNLDPDSPENWNWGPALFEVYAKSATLQAIFPEGKNKYSDCNGVPLRNNLGTIDQSGTQDMLIIADRDGEWLAPNKQSWKLSGLGARTFYDDPKMGRCGEGWRYPSEAEIRYAVQNGLASVALNPKFGAYFFNHPVFDLWASRVAGTGNVIRYNRGEIQLSPQNGNESGSYIAICVKN